MIKIYDKKPSFWKSYSKIQGASTDQSHYFTPQHIEYD